VASGGPRPLARSRELVVTNGYAANVCEAYAANLVGDGIKPSSLIEDGELRDRIQRLWLAWTDQVYTVCAANSSHASNLAGIARHRDLFD